MGTIKPFSAPNSPEGNSSSTSIPSSYKEMDDWLNTLTNQEWTAVIGAYADGGFSSVVTHIRSAHAHNIKLWRDKDLIYYWYSRSWKDFKSRSERSNK